MVAAGSVTTQIAGRLFFALWPPPKWAGRLGAVAEALGRRRGGRPVPAGNIHLTLVFAGAVAVELGGRVAAAGEGLDVPPFELHLDEWFEWPRSRVAGLACSQPPPGLGRLAGELAARLAMLGLKLDRRPFVPHMTLWRGGRRRAGDGARLPGGPPEWERTDGLPFRWTVRDFVLVSSRTKPAGAHYALLRRYELAAPQ